MKKKIKSFGDTIGGRLRTLRETHGLRQKDFANIMGVTDKTVSRYEFGETSPTHDFLIRVIEHFNCDDLWLFTGRDARSAGLELRESGAMNETAAQRDGVKAQIDTSSNLSGYERIPIVETQIPEIGSFVVSAKDEPLFAFKKEWLGQIASDANNLRIMRVRDSGMAPTMRDGDLVIIDTGRTQIRGGGIFVINVNNNALIKRLEPVASDCIRVISDNPVLPTYEMQMSEICVLARVLWSLSMVC